MRTRLSMGCGEADFSCLPCRAVCPTLSESGIPFRPRHELSFERIFQTQGAGRGAARCGPAPRGARHTRVGVALFAAIEPDRHPEPHASPRRSGRSPPRYIILYSPSQPNRGDQAGSAHTVKAPAFHIPSRGESIIVDTFRMTRLSQTSIGILPVTKLQENNKYQRHFTWI